jgi:hypothetical protein
MFILSCFWESANSERRSVDVGVVVNACLNWPIASVKLELCAWAILHAMRAGVRRVKDWDNDTFNFPQSVIVECCSLLINHLVDTFRTNDRLTSTCVLRIFYFLVQPIVLYALYINVRISLVSGWVSWVTLFVWRTCKIVWSLLRIISITKSLSRVCN